jgi:hypothetical protein
MTNDLQWVFDVDLGELCDGHHVVARGIRNVEPSAELHFDYVPGMRADEAEERPFFWYWWLYASDDLGTEYNDNNSGSFSHRGGDSSPGERDLGGVIPSDASALTLRFEPVGDSKPSGPWIAQLDIDLRSGTVTRHPGT